MAGLNTSDRVIAADDDSEIDWQVLYSFNKDLIEPLSVQICEQSFLAIFCPSVQELSL